MGGVAMVLDELKSDQNLVVLTSSSTQSLHAFTNKYLDQNYVDHINDGLLQTRLTMEEYLIFYGIANGVYGKEYVNEIRSYIEQFKLENYYKEPVCSLSCIDRLLVRLFITIQKKAKIVLIDNSNGLIFDEELNSIISQMQVLAKKIGIYCVIMTRKSPIIERYKGVLHQL